MDIYSYNSKAWDKEANSGSPWSKPVSTKEVQEASKGNFKIILTPTKAVPKDWLNPIKGLKILCLASGGGQQGPLLAAAGAEVTVFDASEEQLKRDKLVAKREKLNLTTIKGDMKDLSIFSNSYFDLIVNPASNCFVPDVKPVWTECFRVLKNGGFLLSGFNNPICYAWDLGLSKKDIFQLKYKIPYSDLDSLSKSEREEYIGENMPLEFGHTLQDQIGGQTNAGFSIVGFYEDKWGDNRKEDDYYSTFMVTRSKKP